MRNFVLSRLGATVLILVSLTAVMFVLQHISPMDPVSPTGANASAEAVAAVGMRWDWTSQCSTSSGIT